MRQVSSVFYNNPSENGFSAEIFEPVNDLSKMEFERGAVIGGSGVIVSAGNTGVLKSIISVGFDYSDGVCLSFFYTV